MAYVYGLFEETEEELDNCFYIGKGCGYRMNEHFSERNLNPETTNNPHKVNKILKIKRKGREFYAEKIIDNVSSDKAYQLERRLIEEIGLDNLTNFKIGGCGFGSGENHANTFLTEEDVLSIRKEYKKGEKSQSKLAEEYGTSQSAITLIAKGESWSQAGGPIAGEDYI